MGMTTEPRDDVTMSSGLLRRKRKHEPQLRWRFRNELLHQLHAQILARKIFGMSKRQTEEDLLPWVLERHCMANLDTFVGQNKRLRIVSVRAGPTPMNRSRKLVEYDDERQTRSRAASPRVHSRRSARSRRGENLLIISVSAPPRNHHSTWRRRSAGSVRELSSGNQNPRTSSAVCINEFPYISRDNNALLGVRL